MPKDYFQFKQFLVKQDKCAMKVCTDACLFGAWAADKSEKSKVRGEKVLDIGTGTGLLTLMLAQTLRDAGIDAVEVDEAAAEQARENFEASRWKKRLNVYNTSIQQFASSSIRKLKYDLIISNPPFYESNLKSNNTKRNLALHSDELKLDELINIVYELLNDDGSFFVLLPFHRTEYFIYLCKGKFFVREKVVVRQTPKHLYFRSMLWLMKREIVTTQSEVTITDDKNEYSNSFKNLLKEYYLYL